MKPSDIASATESAIHDVPAKFMVDPATYQRGGELGFGGMDFYVAGRGGVLGDVIGDVVAAAFIFFEPGMVNAAWDRAASVMPRRDAGQAFAECGYDWGRAHVADDDAARTVVALAGKVIDAASPAGLPIFAAWRSLPVPGDAPAAVINRLNALRELRGALHGAAVLTAGLTPVEAMAVREPEMAALFGWTDQLPPVGEVTPQWNVAENATDLAVGVVLSVLDDSEAEDFVAAAAQIGAQVAD